MKKEKKKTGKKRHVRTHSFLQILCMICKLFALRVFQNLVVLHVSQLHVPAEDPL